jgi:hypothetical protein
VTARSVVIGMIGVVFVASVTFLNDLAIGSRGTYFIGNLMPISVFGGMVFLTLIVSPLLGRVSRRLVLSAREWAVVLALVLFACCVPGRSLMHLFSNVLMMPHHHARTEAWGQGLPPELNDGDVLDWGLFARRLARPPDGETDQLAGVRSRLPESASRTFADAATTGTVAPVHRADVLAAVNGLLAEPRLFDTEAFDLDETPLPKHAEALLERSPDDLPREELKALNRALLESACGDSLRRRAPPPIALVPRRMLADPSRDPDRALAGFVTGLGEGNERIGYGDVPWGAWTRTYLFWIPLILTFFATVVGLALVIHERWAHQEHLPYPIVEFARSMLPPEGKAASPLLRSGAFWWAAGIVFCIHGVNYVHAWWPSHTVAIPLRIDASSLLDIFTTFPRDQSWYIFAPTIHFTAIGFSYFVAREVSFSMGIAPYAYCFVLGILLKLGVSMSGETGNDPAAIKSLLTGAYVGAFVMLVYAGRHFYLHALRRGVGLSSGETIRPATAWGMRVFLMGAGLFVIQLMLVGIDWPVALLFTTLVIIFYVVATRLMAEGGAFFIQTFVLPSTVLWALMGPRSVGPTVLMVTGLVGVLLVLDTREILLPFAATGLRLADRTGARPGRTALWGGIAICVALAIAVPVTLRLQYQHGAPNSGSWWWMTRQRPSLVFNRDRQIRTKLESQGRLAEAESVSGFRRFLNVRPHRGSLLAFAIAFGLVVACAALRNRFPRWPIHPVLFLMLGTWPSLSLGPSFLMGWAINSTAVRYGGRAARKRLKPVMVGLIAGEMMIGVTMMAIGAVYYCVTGAPPQTIRLLPG